MEDGTCFFPPMDGLDSIQDIVSTSLGELPTADLLKNRARKDICNHYPRNYTGLSFLAVSTANRRVKAKTGLHLGSDVNKIHGYSSRVGPLSVHGDVC